MQNVFAASIYVHSHYTHTHTHTHTHTQRHIHTHTHMSQPRAPIVTHMNARNGLRYHGAAIELHGVVNVSVSACRFERLDNNAILLSGYTRDVAIRNNTAAWLGMNFAAAWGDTDGIDGTGTLF